MAAASAAKMVLLSGSLLDSWRQVVSPFRNKKFYSKLPDGLHPGEDLCSKWGELIAQRIDANFSVSMSAATAPLPLTYRIENVTPEEDHSPSRPRKREWKTY